MSPLHPHEVVVDVVVPAYNEAGILEANVGTLHAYLAANLPYAFVITIAESGSSDGTREIADRLAARYERVRVRSDPRRGRGLALREAWTASEAEVVAYIDADLSIDLDALLPLIAPVVSGHSELAIGTRHAAGARVRRSALRAVLSRTLNFLLRIVLGARFSDAQCGLKAGRRDVLLALMPDVRAQHWFFDTELLFVAQAHDLRIHEVPIDCLDDPDTSVDIGPTVWTFLKQIAGLAVRQLRGRVASQIPAEVQRERLALGPRQQALRFVAVGAFTTVVHAALFLALRPVLSAVVANVVALAVATVVNTAANRSVTFFQGARGNPVREQVEGAGAFLLSVAVTSAALTLVGGGAGRGVEAVVVVTADLVAAGIRFALMRYWIFASGPRKLRVARKLRA